MQHFPLSFAKIKPNLTRRELPTRSASVRPESRRALGGCCQCLVVKTALRFQPIFVRRIRGVEILFPQFIRQVGDVIASWLWLGAGTVTELLNYGFNKRALLSGSGHVVPLTRRTHRIT